MAVGVHGVNHVACLARDMDETVRFYQGFLDIKVRRVVNDTPGQKHYSLDLGGEGTLDFFEAKPGTEDGERDAIGALNHLAITADPDDVLTQQVCANVWHVGHRKQREMRYSQVGVGQRRVRGH